MTRVLTQAVLCAGNSQQLIINTADHSDLHAANKLVSMHAKCGKMNDARKVFDSIKHPDVVSWTVLMMGYASNGECGTALSLFAEMTTQGCTPNGRTFAAAFKACTKLALNGEANVKLHKLLRHLALVSGCHLDIYVQSSLVNMYAKCGNMIGARSIFDGIEHPNVVCWNALILGYAENGDGEMSLGLFSRMGTEGIKPDWTSFVAAIKACIDISGKTGNRALLVNRGKMLHLLTSVCGCDLDVPLRNALVHMYAKFGKMQDSLRVFKSIGLPDVVSWTALINGYAENGNSWEALELFSRMKREGCMPNARAFVAAAKACCKLTNNNLVHRMVGILHLLSMQSGFDLDVYVQSSILDLYVKCGCIVDARGVFDSMTRPNVVCWNVLMLGYSDEGDIETALALFTRMKAEGCTPDSWTFVSALKACALNPKPQRRGKMLHLLALRRGFDTDLYVQATLVDLYAKAGNLKQARTVFEGIKERNVVCWNALILGYADNGEPWTTLKMFSRMEREGCMQNARTFVAVLKACTELATVENCKENLKRRGMKLHLLALQRCCEDVYVMNTLVNMYAKFGSMALAQEVFDTIKQRDVVCWNALLMGYVDNGEGAISLKLFSQMKRDGCPPDALTYAAVMKACNIAGVLEIGRKLHDEIDSGDLKDDPVIGNVLVDFYAKCGSLREAKHVFDTQSSKSLVSWTALMIGYSSQGCTRYVIELFDTMLETGIQPDDVIFNCILTACSRAGLVEKGKMYFEAMYARFGLCPNVEHYNCIMDLLGRANKLDEAMMMLRDMIHTPNAVTWMTILAACSKWSNLHMGELAFESLLSLDDGHEGAYVLMANLYGARS